MRKVGIKSCSVVTSVAGTAAELYDLVTGQAPPRLPEDPLVPLASLEAAAGLPSRETRKVDRFSLLAVAAARRALEVAGVEGDDLVGCGIVTGNMLAGWTFTEPQLRALHGQGLEAVSPYLATAWFPAAPQGQVTINLGMQGFAKTVTTDRCSGAQAIGLAAERIASGRSGLLLAGGVEAPRTPLVERALASQAASLAEGAAYLLLAPAAPGDVAIGAHDTFPIPAEVRPREWLVGKLARFARQLTGAAPPSAVVLNLPTEAPADGAADMGGLASELEAALAEAWPRADGDVWHQEDFDLFTLTPKVGDCLAASGALAAVVACEALSRRPAPGSSLVLSWGHQCCDLLWVERNH